MSDRLCVIMPVYNEEGAIGSVLEKWVKALDALRIDYLIRPYNDGSKDNSLSVMKAAAVHLPRVEVRDKPNGGHGNTILTGYREAAADGFDWIFQVDSDDEMGPDEFGALWARRKEYDFLVGRRQGRKQPFARKVISFMSRRCVRLFYGNSVWDVNTPYRLMRVCTFRSFYEAIPLTTFAPNVILSGLASREHLRCHEMLVPQHDRTTGEVSIKKWKLLKAAAKSFVQTIVFSLRPMGWKSFTALGLLFLGTIWIFASNPFVDYTLTDGSVFLYVGEQMHDGFVPYRDVFDHKGPLLYFLNYIGSAAWPSTIWLWVIESVSWWCSLGIVFVFLRRCFASLNPLFVLTPFAAFHFMFIMGSSGNLSESWSLPFVLYILLTILMSVKDGRLISESQCLLIGSCSASILLLRPNNASVAFIAALYWFCEILPKGGVRRFVRTFVLALLGFGLITIPFAVYYAAKGALPDLWTCYISFNMAYMGYLWWWESIILWALPFILVEMIAIMKYNGWTRKFHVYNLVFLSVTTAVFLLRPNWLYMLVLLPGFVLPLTFVMNCDYRYMSRIMKIGVTFVSLLVLGVAFARANFDLGGYLRSIRTGGSAFTLLDWREGHTLRDVERFLDKIPNRNSVCVLGNACCLYRHLGIKTEFKYPYQLPIAKVSSNINDMVRAHILSGQESCFICQRQELKVFEDWLNVKYVCTDQTDDFLLYLPKAIVNK